jgi:hypothetical protein
MSFRAENPIALRRLGSHELPPDVPAFPEPPDNFHYVAGCLIAAVVAWRFVRRPELRPYYKQFVCFWCVPKRVCTPAPSFFRRMQWLFLPMVVITDDQASALVSNVPTDASIKILIDDAIWQSCRSGRMWNKPWSDEPAKRNVNDMAAGAVSELQRVILMVPSSKQADHGRFQKAFHKIYPNVRVEATVEYITFRHFYITCRHWAYRHWANGGKARTHSLTLNSTHSLTLDMSDIDLITIAFLILCFYIYMAIFFLVWLYSLQRLSTISLPDDEITTIFAFWLCSCGCPPGAVAPLLRHNAIDEVLTAKLGFDVKRLTCTESRVSVNSSPSDHPRSTTVATNAREWLNAARCLKVYNDSLAVISPWILFPSLFKSETKYCGFTEHGCLRAYLSEMGLTGREFDAPDHALPLVMDAYGAAYALLRCAVLEYGSSWVDAYRQELASHRLAVAARITLPRPILAESQQTLWQHAAGAVHVPTAASTPMEQLKDELRKSTEAVSYRGKEPAVPRCILEVHLEELCRIVPSYADAAYRLAYVSDQHSHKVLSMCRYLHHRQSTDGWYALACLLAKADTIALVHVAVDYREALRRSGRQSMEESLESTPRRCDVLLASLQSRGVDLVTLCASANTVKPALDADAFKDLWELHCFLDEYAAVMCDKNTDGDITARLTADYVRPALLAAAEEQLKNPLALEADPVLKATVVDALRIAVSANVPLKSTVDWREPVPLPPLAEKYSVVRERMSRCYLNDAPSLAATLMSGGRLGLQGMAAAVAGTEDSWRALQADSARWKALVDLFPLARTHPDEFRLDLLRLAVTNSTVDLKHCPQLWLSMAEALRRDNKVRVKGTLYDHQGCLEMAYGALLHEPKDEAELRMTRACLRMLRTLYSDYQSQGHTVKLNAQSAQNRLDELDKLEKKRSKELKWWSQVKRLWS